MNNELISALDALEKENGISKDVMFETIEKALLEEYKQQYENEENCTVTIDKKTGEFHIYSDRTVVPDDDERCEDAEYNGLYIGMSDAMAIDPDVKEGDIVRVDMKRDGFTRTASRAAKDRIIQKIREEQKAAMFNEFKQREGQLITGIVQRIDDRGNILLDIGKTQVDLRTDEQVPGETYRQGDRVRVVLKEVSSKEKKGTLIKVSRKAAELVACLFKEGVAEIQDGIVEIKGIAREAGSRTKMAVMSHDPDVDPVGSCVGKSGDRVRQIVNELGNEQIDIINWDENPAQLIVNALSPAKVVQIVADVDEQKAKLIVSDQQLSLAIGKAGQNVRLAAKLTGYSIDIKSESQITDTELEKEFYPDEDDADDYSDEYSENNNEDIENEKNYDDSDENYEGNEQQDDFSEDDEKSDDEI